MPIGFIQYTQRRFAQQKPRAASDISKEDSVCTMNKAAFCSDLVQCQNKLLAR